MPKCSARKPRPTNNRLPEECMWQLIALCAAFALVATIRSALIIVRVRGDSMTPTLFDDDLLVGARCWSWQSGSIIVFRSENELGQRDSYLVKRVAAVSGEAVPFDFPESFGRIVPPGVLLVRGDAARSLDSRQLGYIPVSAVVAVTVCGLVPLRWLTARQAATKLEIADDR
ncbi:S26 family signal peptidase [Micromonospora sp. NPDC050276]|uniref:S26 family signal peptidase n=1 Tax=Micromonospora sp. NPDC050276 TaxID=3364278 RepID=UPI003787B4F3